MDGSFLAFDFFHNKMTPGTTSGISNDRISCSNNFTLAIGLRPQPESAAPCSYILHVYLNIIKIIYFVFKYNRNHIII